MTPERRAQIEWECIRLSGAFSYHLDFRNYEALAALFAPDGIWLRHGETLQGADAILAAMAKRPPNQFTRHVTSNRFFTRLDERSAASFAHNMTYFSMEKGVDQRRFEPANVIPLDFIDEYVLTEKGWRFSKRETTPYMLPEHVRKMLAEHH